MAEKNSPPSSQAAPRVQLWDTPQGWTPKPAVPQARPPGSHSPVTIQPNSLSRTKARYASFVDRRLPSQRYLGLKRRTFLWTLLAIILSLLTLIIGLAAGLTARSKHQFLPLPSNSASFTGDLTYYGPGLGACGITSSDSDSIVSVSHFLFDREQSGSDPNQNPLCGKMIRAERFDEEAGAKRSVDLKVVDRCTGCQPQDLDVSPGAFGRLASMDLGRVRVTWAWLD